MMGVDKAKKLEALSNFTAMAGQNPAFAYLLGFLTGQVDRVFFVRDLEDAKIALRMSVGRQRIWPAQPLQATISGVIMPTPLAFVSAAGATDDPICVSLEFDHADETPWYQEVLLPNVSYVRDFKKTVEEESFRVRAEMDRALDIYKECKEMLAKDPARQKELSYYLKVAEEELRNLGNKLAELNVQMKRISSDS
ncbi:MAG TPA: hypothetical protein GX510_04055 [Firmicutes bacterium]|nr:hypothetical protein [Candidatus Fermentithermobacillaceae bacterium]